MLQTVLNPLQRTVGGEENYAFIAELAQFMFGIASFLSPLVYTYLIRELDPATYTAGKGFFIDLLLMSLHGKCRGYLFTGYSPSYY